MRTRRASVPYGAVVSFADPRRLRRQQIDALREDLERAETDQERERLRAELRELKKFRWSRLLFPFTGQR
jgi:hypothetical protein